VFLFRAPRPADVDSGGLGLHATGGVAPAACWWESKRRCFDVFFEGREPAFPVPHVGGASASMLASVVTHPHTPPPVSHLCPSTYSCSPPPAPLSPPAAIPYLLPSGITISSFSSCCPYYLPLQASGTPAALPPRTSSSAFSPSVYRAGPDVAGPDHGGPGGVELLLDCGLRRARPLPRDATAEPDLRLAAEHLSFQVPFRPAASRSAVCA